MKSNSYWAQVSRENGISPRFAISPIFHTQKEYQEWAREARKQGKTFINCADRLNPLRINC